MFGFGGKTIVKEIRKGKEVSEKVEELFGFYDAILSSVNKIKAIYDKSENKPSHVKGLIDSVKDWATARGEMYNPLKRDAYLAPFLLQNL